MARRVVTGTLLSSSCVSAETIKARYLQGSAPFVYSSPTLMLTRRHKQMIPTTPYSYSITTQDAEVQLDSLPSTQIIGLDTETCWEPTAKRMHVSLVQIAVENHPVVILDALHVDLAIVRPLIESAEIRMAAHNARFDESVLAGAGFKPRGFVDTLTLARRALNLSSYALTSVVEELFGAPLDKSLQKSNWRRRPLTRDQLAYAAHDAAITLRVYQELIRRLAEAGKLEVALHAAQLEWREPGERKPRVRRTKTLQLAPLTNEEKAIVNRLKQWRLDYSRTQHIPAYMICADKTLEHLAQTKPATRQNLAATYGLGAAKVARFGDELLEALRHALEAQVAEK